MGDVPGGVAVLDPDVAHSQDNNRLLLTDPVDADTVESATEEVGGNAGWPHRAAGAAVAGRRRRRRRAARRRAGTPQELAADGPPGRPDRRRGARRGGGRARRCTSSGRESWRRDLPDRPGPGARDRRPGRAGSTSTTAVVAVTNLVVREAGPGGRLRSAPGGRRRRRRSTRCSPIPRRAAAGTPTRSSPGRSTWPPASGCDLVVLEAAADDWPRHWYARRGFAELGIGLVGGPSRPEPLRPARAPTAAGRPRRPTAAASPAGPSGRRGRAAGGPCP